ncbi:MAG: flagellar hook-associated protein FlgK [Ignavibacteriae bacterium]|nr:flagellar hook-associated protein FlgK [Ignavibacteriota bacterium]
MPGLFGLLELGRRALSAQSSAMNVTSHNIANASTPGYTRQRANLGATLPALTAQGLFLGTGVNLDSIDRLRDRFIDMQYRQANTSLGSASLRQSILSQIEAVLNEPSDSGLQSAMSSFFNSFQELANHPEETGPRTNVLQQATRLVQTFNRMSNSFTTQRNDLVEDVTRKVDRINQLTHDIGELNNQIVTMRGVGQEPSDLMDQRDLKLDELSKLTNVSVSQDSQGSMLVSIGGTLVASNGSSLAIQVSVTAAEMKVSTVTGADVPVTGGELSGVLDLYNNVIPGYMSQLDSLANTIITRVNAVHSAGYGLGNPPPTGVTFFTGNSAGNIGIYSQVASNTNFIAASSNGQPGNNDTALALFGITNERLLDGNTQTLSQYYGRFVSTVGSALSSAEGETSGIELILGQLDAQRESVSGVSLDEEMTNLIRFQRSFEAAARVVNTANELFDTILNMV